MASGRRTPVALSILLLERLLRLPSPRSARIFAPRAALASALARWKRFFAAFSAMRSSQDLNHLRRRRPTPETPEVSTSSRFSTGVGFVRRPGGFILAMSVTVRHVLVLARVVGGVVARALSVPHRLGDASMVDARRERHPRGNVGVGIGVVDGRVARVRRVDVDDDVARVARPP